MDSTYTTYETVTTTTSSGDAGLALASLIVIFTIMLLPIILLVMVPAIIGLWKTFTKAHQPGWAAIVPIYNTVVLLKIVGRPVWWILLLFVPIVSFVVTLVVCLDLAKAFGKDVLFGLLIWLFSPIMLLIIAFNREIEYKGPLAAGTDMFSSFHNSSTAAQPAASYAPQPPTTPPVAGTTIPPATPEVPTVGGQPTPPAGTDQNKTV
ncbi:MAG: DUF5684 domain-containing protein [Candidatus Saccharimonas sp.]